MEIESSLHLLLRQRHRKNKRVFVKTLEIRAALVFSFKYFNLILIWKVLSENVVAGSVGALK